MNAHSLISLLQRAAVAVAETAEHRSTDRAWSWSKHVLIQPELRCPWCKTPITTKGWLWFVSEAFLLGQFKMEHGKTVVLEYPDHPHAMGGGLMCFGRSRGVETISHAFVSLSRGHGTRGWQREAFEYLMGWLKKYCGHAPCPANPTHYLGH